MNTNVLTISFLRATGWVAETIQQQRGPVRYDPFGGDILAIHPSSEDTRLINACRAGRDMKDHMRRYRGFYPLSVWLRGGDRVFALYAWRKVKPRKKKPYLVLTISRAMFGGTWQDEGVYACRMNGAPL